MISAGRGSQGASGALAGRLLGKGRGGGEVGSLPAGPLPALGSRWPAAAPSPAPAWPHLSQVARQALPWAFFTLDWGGCSLWGTASQKWLSFIILGRLSSSYLDFLALSSRNSGSLGPEWAWKPLSFTSPQVPVTCGEGFGGPEDSRAQLPPQHPHSPGSRAGGKEPPESFRGGRGGRGEDRREPGGPQFCPYQPCDIGQPFHTPVPSSPK